MRQDLTIRLREHRLARRGFLTGAAALLLTGAASGPGRALAAAKGKGNEPEVRNDLLGEEQVVEPQDGETMMDMARRLDLGFIELQAANPGVDPWFIKNRPLVLAPTRHVMPDAPREGIVINVGDMRLYYFRKGGTVTHPIGIGREGWTTPLGSTTVRAKKANPTWTPPASIREEKPELPAVVPAGPDNPLGAHALYLGWKSYLLHGTNAPDGVGRAVSHGCIRLYPEDVESLFKTVPIGTKVTVVDQPIKVGWAEKDLYLEAHPDYQQANALEEDGKFDIRRTTEQDFEGLIESTAGSQAGRVDWRLARRVALQRRGYPVRIKRPTG